MKKITLKKYYKTKHWAEIRNNYSYSDDSECEFCHTKRWDTYKVGKNKGKRKKRQSCHLQLHHKSYDNLYKEDREDFLLLCDSCHKLGHLLERMKNKSVIYKNMYEDLVGLGWTFKRRK